MGARVSLGSGQQPELEHLPWGGQIPATILCCRWGSVRPGRNPRGHRTAPATWHPAFLAPSPGTMAGSAPARRGQRAELPTDAQQRRFWLAVLTSAPQHAALEALSSLRHRHPTGVSPCKASSPQGASSPQKASARRGASTPRGALSPYKASAPYGASLPHTESSSPCEASSPHRLLPSSGHRHPLCQPPCPRCRPLCSFCLLGDRIAFWSLCLLGDGNPFCIFCLLGDMGIFWLLGDKITFACLGTGSLSTYSGTR